MKSNEHLTTLVFVLGRFIVGGMYLMAGIENLLLLDAKAGYAASKGVSNASFWVVVASLLLVLGGSSLITGIRPHIAVGALAVFLVPVTLIMHNFWTLTGLQATIEFHAFMGNVGLLGSALLFVAIPQPWPFSLDKWVVSKFALLTGRRRRTVARQNTTADA